ncbi:MAG: hypothetical protein LBC75_07410, partial [Fibromonadaceae bacterium]|nr:hypothetical protein [Fibromonadaceae bacterium]
MKHLFLFLVLVSSISAFAVQYQAKDATLGGDATISGDYVQMKGGDLTFNSVSVSQAEMYDIRINYKQDYDEIKKQKLVVNGEEMGEVAFPRIATWTDVVAVARLKSGNNTIAIRNSWGWVDIKYIDVVPHESASFNLDPLVNPNANAAAKKMYAFLQENFQKKVMSGVMTGEVLNGNTAATINTQKEVAHIRTSSGNKTPALVGFDFMHGTGKEFKGGNTWNKSYTAATISLAKELYGRGGIPAFCWHWRDPLKSSEGFYSPSSSGGDKTTFDLTKACTNSSCTAWNTNSAEYKGIVEDLDIVAGYLKELQDAGVAVLWRPVHEASGGWFWWGGKGAAPLKLLYKLIFEKFTNEHHLNNLIWVWTSEGADYDWYPGNEYADIIGRDFYYSQNDVVNHASLIGEFEKLKNLFGTKKIIALSENGSVPYPSNMKADGAGWSYFMPWYGNFVTQSTPAAAWNTIMNDSYTITLESMPG